VQRENVWATQLDYLLCLVLSSPHGRETAAEMERALSVGLTSGPAEICGRGDALGGSDAGEPRPGRLQRDR
jgi:hypothetical protein